MKLNQKDSEKAWEAFTQKYIQLIFNVIHKFCQDHDDVMDIYAFALENLKEKDCKRLTSYFQKKRNCNFEAWITVIVRNICFDWFRKEKGRKRLSESIKSLPPFDQRIFEYVFKDRYSHSEVFELLKSKHNFNSSFEELCQRIENINNSLTAKTKWNLVNDWNFLLSPVPFDLIDISSSKINKTERPVESNPVEENIFKGEQLKILNDIVNSLPSQERLLLKLHFKKGLTLKEITSILKTKNIWKTHRILKKTIQNIRNILKEKGLSSPDFDNL